MDEDQEELLRILESHGKQFLNSFASSVSIGKRKEPSVDEPEPKKRRLRECSDEEEEEWGGFLGSDGSLEEGSTDNEDQEDGMPIPICEICVTYAHKQDFRI